MGVVIGNGRGLVGFREANGGGSEVLNKAADAAMRTVDYVVFFEGRTIWTEMENKFGTSRIIPQPRPRGFGLACNPHLHSLRVSKISRPRCTDLVIQLRSSRASFNFYIVEVHHLVSGMVLVVREGEKR